MPEASRQPETSHRESRISPLEILTVLGELPYNVLEHMVGEESIAVAEQAAMIELVEPHVRGRVRPLEVVPMPASERIRVSRAIAESLTSLPETTLQPDVGSRLANLLTATDSYVPDIIVAASRAALLRGDADQASTLSAFGLGHDTQNLELLHIQAMALESLGRHAAATALDVTDAGSGDPAWLGRWASNLFLATGRKPLVELASDLDDEQGEMRASLAWIEALEGDVDKVAATVNGVLDNPNSSAQAVVWACVAGALPAAIDGRAHIATVMVSHGTELLAQLPDELSPFAALQVGLVDSLVHTRLGYLLEGARIAENMISTAESPFFGAVWSFFAGIARREMGAFAEARHHFERGLEGVEADPFGLIAWGQSEAAVCNRFAGVASPSNESESESEQGHGLFRACLLRNYAWLEAADGRVSEAIYALTTAVEVAHELGQNVHAALAIMDLARFGDLTAACELVRQLDRADAPLLFLAREHVRALDSDTSESLHDAQRKLRSAHFHLHADELLYRLRQKAGRSRDLHQLARLDLLGEPVSWPTPILEERTNERQLTHREAEVAVMGAHGDTSRTIGERLNISARTVDNLLGRVYQKCEFTGRDDLGRWLDHPT